MKDPCRYSAVEAAAAIVTGKLTSVALVEACLARSAEREKDVHAWAYLNPELALRQARARDRQVPRGSLWGVPLGVKDVIDTADMPTAYGSAIYRGHQPKWDAPCVALAREAGAIVMGKTVTTEFASRHPGETRNPHDPGRTPGGSSSGSAASVADFMVPLALGTQSLGSVIRPAAYCGIVGYKPTFNTIMRPGIKPLLESLDTVGVFARTVADTAVLAGAVSGRRVPDFERETVTAPRIGFCRTPQWPHAEEATIAALEDVVSQLRSADARVRELTLPKEFDGLARAAEIIDGFELWRSLAFERQAFPDLLSPELTQAFEKGRRWTRDDFEAGHDLAQTCRSMLDDVFADYDVLLAPAAPGEAPHGLADTGPPIFNGLWTLLHAPCVTLPVLEGPSGLPMGVQVIGGRNKDDRMLICAEWMQRALT